MKFMSCLQMMKVYLFTWCEFSWEDTRRHLFTLEKAQRKDYAVVQLVEPMTASKGDASKYIVSLPPPKIFSIFLWTSRV